MKTKKSEASEKANARQGGRYAATIHSDINLLREPASGSRGARHPHVLHVHSGACAPGFPNAGPLATISVAMYKKLLALFLFALLSSAHAGESEIRQSLQSKFPGIGKIEHVVKTPYAGLYEIVVGDQLLYTDAQGQYLFDGNIIETKSRRNMSEERRRQLFAVEFDKLPLELAVKKVKGNGKRKMAYFTDPNCGFCKRLEKDLAKVSDVTLYLFLYPLQPGADEIVRNILCSKNPAKAWDDLMLDSIRPASATCNTSTDKVMALGNKLRVNGTPNLIFGDGTQSPGYLPAEELEKRLNETGNK